MRKQFHFKNHPLTIKCPTYCKPFTWMAPEPNSTPTLRKLGSNPDFAIKPFDKGSGICLKDTSLYINNIEEKLANVTIYKELDTNPIQAIRNDVFFTLDYLHITHRIDDETRHHLTLTNATRSPLFYGLPKVHKPIISLWPIVSACDSPTNQLSNYVTHFIQSCGNTPLLHTGQQTLSPAPGVPLTLTWECRHSHCWCHITLHQHTTWRGHRICTPIHQIICWHLPPGAPSPHTIGILLQIILKNNNLSFIDKHFLQLVGRAMGTKASPPYANLFRGRHNEMIREAFI